MRFEGEKKLELRVEENVKRGMEKPFRGVWSLEGQGRRRIDRRRGGDGECVEQYQPECAASI